MKKFEFSEETQEVNGVTLHRIVAVRDFGSVKIGDHGGWIEKEANLSHDDLAWVSGNARVYGDAWVSGNAAVYGDARVYDNARVYGNAWVYGDAWVSGNAEVCGNAQVYDNAWVSGNAAVYGDAQVYGDAWVSGNARVYGNAAVYGNARVYGDAQVCGNADYVVFKNWWSSGRYFTWTRSNNKWRVGCFYGTGEELIAKACRDSEKSGREYERVVRYVEEAFGLREK